MKKSLAVFCLIGLLGAGRALECYVCENQGDNKDKCVKTTIQCKESQDTCMTRLYWHAPTFWTPRNVKIHHIFKSCSTSTYCARRQRQLGLTCMRDWYRDWQCIECCQGDRCNFYVTLDAGSVRSNIAVLVATVVASSVYALCHGH